MLDELANVHMPTGTRLHIEIVPGDEPIQVTVYLTDVPVRISRAKCFTRNFCRQARFSFQHEVDSMIGDLRAHHQDQRHQDFASAAPRRS